MLNGIAGNSFILSVFSMMIFKSMLVNVKDTQRLAFL
jgi:hypothetical protein